MNPRQFYLAALVASAAVAGCATVQPETEEQKQERCAVDAIMTGIGQQAKNEGMSQAEFNKRLKEMERNPDIDQNDLALAKKGLTKGFAGIRGADAGIMAQKAFDDCMEAK